MVWVDLSKLLQLMQRDFSQLPKSPREEPWDCLFSVSSVLFWCPRANIAKTDAKREEGRVATEYQEGSWGL